MNELPHFEDPSLLRSGFLAGTACPLGLEPTSTASEHLTSTREESEVLPSFPRTCWRSWVTTLPFSLSAGHDSGVSYKGVLLRLSNYFKPSAYKEKGLKKEEIKHLY